MCIVITLFLVTDVVLLVGLATASLFKSILYFLYILTRESNNVKNYLINNLTGNQDGNKEKN
jgi:predicted CDP-diglyceride synthetase/phosphatidate cytidylyltransferase